MLIITIVTKKFIIPPTDRLTLYLTNLSRFPISEDSLLMITPTGMESKNETLDFIKVSTTL